MDGAVERSAKTRPAQDLAAGAGESAPLSDKENFAGGPHPDQAQIDDHLYDDDFDDAYDDDDDWLEQECGLHADGQCGMAGTEHCDFVCPYRDSEDFAGSEAWHRKHGRSR